MFRIEKLGRIDIGADILDHDIRRIAPATDSNVAIGLCKAFKSGAISAPDDPRYWFGWERRGRLGVDLIGTCKISLEHSSHPHLPSS